MQCCRRRGRYADGVFQIENRRTEEEKQMFYYGLILGILIGGFIGIIVTSMAVAAHNADR